MDFKTNVIYCGGILREEMSSGPTDLMCILNSVFWDIFRKN